MMLDRIIKAIRADGRASDFRLTETAKTGIEWYFSRTALDTARSVRTREYSLTLYVDGDGSEGRTRGAYAVSIHPGSADTEIRSAVNRAVRAASGMKNPWYPIPEPSTLRPAPMPSGFQGAAPEQAMEGLRAALYRPDGTDGASINSLELFLSREDVRVVNSRGVDVSWTEWSGFTEFVVNASAPGSAEVELYGNREFSDPDPGRLTSAVRELLIRARDRLRARPTPACDGMPILFRGEQAMKLYGYWFGNAQSKASFEKTAAFAIGEDVSGGDGGGDPIGLKAVSYVPGSTASAPYDSDGVPLGSVECIVGNRLSRLVGPLKYAHYLGIEPTGGFRLFELAPGARSIADLAARPHLEAAAFSDFFVEETTGDFGGELRLGYLFDGKTGTPVSGGSITGNLGENRGRILLSSEMENHPYCRGPAACLVPAASVAPAG